jgi:MFS family permease
VIGPILVGGAVLAEQRLGGAGALATVFVGFGAGSVLGLLAAGWRAPRRRGLVLVSGTAVIGAGTAGFGVVGGLVTAVATAAVVGAGAAYLGVVLVAWLQELVPGHLRGRVMSLVVLAAVAFDPLSFALAGLLLPAGVTVMFAVCGLLILLTAVVAAAVPVIRRLR